MSTYRYSAPEGVCTVEGCNNPRHVTKGGTRITVCFAHYRERFQKQARGIPESTRPRPPAPPPRSVSILVIDWQTEQVYRVTGRVEGVNPLPATHGALMKMVALASQADIYVAYVRPYKDEDLK